MHVDTLGDECHSSESISNSRGSQHERGSPSCVDSGEHEPRQTAVFHEPTEPTRTRFETTSRFEWYDIDPRHHKGKVGTRNLWSSSFTSLAISFRVTKTDVCPITWGCKRYVRESST